MQRLDLAPILQAVEAQLPQEDPTTETFTVEAFPGLTAHVRVVKPGCFKVEAFSTTS